jgi:hypothetical protein
VTVPKNVATTAMTTTSVLGISSLRTRRTDEPRPMVTRRSS